MIFFDFRFYFLNGRDLEDFNLKDEVNDVVKEIRYIYIFNRVFFLDIRVLVWVFVEFSFSVRFSCFERIYRYFFFRVDLDIIIMNFVV